MKSVLSIQSNVLRGKVGNAISRDIYSQFPVECTFIDTVYFSGIASQKTFGVVFDRDDWLEFVEKSLLLLREKLDVVHTGYFGSAKQMQAVSSGLSQLSKTIVVVDPVMGDNGKIYVKDCVVQQYQDFLKYATVITPNFFELEVLCQQKIHNLEELVASCQSLIARFSRLQFVVVTSVRFANVQNNIVIVNKEQMHQVEKKFIYEATFGGCGDVFTSLLCCYYCSKPDIVWAARQAIDYLYTVIELCVQNRCGHLDVKHILPPHIKALSIPR
ncbi:PfkB family carbohydrate kinase [Candidatus Uabimicrobium amorphum]|uniref:pyridoxal kinase n=1 Tax=Uabimicrobium amorphum TaxID=2596890 RepID=A0A5S9IMS0_UABAM|nr:PfkB family carbohydrate kinase [Candidatus Uabimicrobium amorphum]BBM84400.1 pyridoxal kinase [Candidatus Uabimicrobium amorphum]